MMFRYCFAIFIGLVLLLQSGAGAQQQQTEVLDVQIPTRVWPGWQIGSIEPDPTYHLTTQPSTEPVHDPSYPTPANQRQQLSGKVMGLASFAGVEVALVPAMRFEYVGHDIETALVRDDGTFDLSLQHPTDRPTTLCIRAPGHPWTFASWDFPAGSSARDIMIWPEEGKRVTISAALREKRSKGWMTVEAYDGYARHDPSGKPLRSQYYGGHQGDDGTASILLPLRPMALRVRADGSAAACVMIDPRNTDRLLVTLPPQAQLVAQVVNGSRIVGGKTVALFNPCQRLSWSALDTGTDGKVELEGLMPGQWLCIVDGHEFYVTLEAGRTTQTKLDLSLPATRPARPGQARVDHLSDQASLVQD